MTRTSRVVVPIMALAVLVLGAVALFNSANADEWERQARRSAARADELAADPDGDAELQDLRTRLAALADGATTREAEMITKDAQITSLRTALEQARTAIDDLDRCAQGAAGPLERAATPSTVPPVTVPSVPALPETSPTTTTTLAPRSDPAAASALRQCQAAQTRADEALSGLEAALNGTAP